MKRLLVIVLVLLLGSGCAALSGNLDRVEVTFTGASATDEIGDYSLVITPNEITYAAGGEKSTHELPEGTWTTLVTGLAAMGSRTAKECPDGQLLELRELSGKEVKQTLQASSCDADGTLDRLQELVAQLVASAK